MMQGISGGTSVLRPQASIAEKPQAARAEGSVTVRAPDKDTPVERLVIPGGTGSQGIALAYAASLNFGKTHSHEILIPVRGDAEAVKKAHNLAVVVDGKDGKEERRLGDMKGVRIVSMGELQKMDGRGMVVVTTVPAPAVASVVASLPKKADAVIATYNGVPRVPKGAKDPDHGTSVFGSFDIDGKRTRFGFKPGSIFVRSASVAASALKKIFAGTFVTVGEVPDDKASQWSKIATNTAVNSLATVLGIRVMDLRKRIDSEKNVADLVKGITHEVYLVAKREGVDVGDFEKFHAGVLAKIPPTFDHLTSTGVDFRAGKPLADEHIKPLSGGVSELAQSELNGAPRIATPLCDKLNKALRELEALRGDGVPADNAFYARKDVQALGSDLLVGATTKSKL